MKMLAMLTSNDEPQQVKHYIGAPPEITRGNDFRQPMGNASFLVIDENSDGVFLNRYQSDGNHVGDTWHRNMEDAKHQAAYEYGGSVGEWRVIPDEVENVVEFSRRQVR